jgi:EAL and modified HD-GYP domain-containing signal transduction protein
MHEPLFLGRQPILDNSHNLVGYELLFRSGDGNSARFSDDFVATATVINHVIGELGIDAALGSYQGFINMNESLLMSDIIEFLPKDKLVLEILESVTINSSIVERCRQLRSAGFKLAIDDFIAFSEDILPLLDIVDIVKIDMALIDPDQLDETIVRLGKWPVKLIAEKVETVEQFDRCVKLGFKLFQGYYFARPHIISGKRLSHSEMALMKLMGLVTGDADLKEIEEALKGNPILSYNLLKLANSAASGLNREISSIRAAITLLGRNKLQRWIQILIYSNSGSNAKFPTPLLQMAAMRGKTMESLAARKREQGFEDKAFMTGSMSLLDALLAIPLPEILSSLALGHDVKDALINREGELGKLLSVVESLELKSPPEIDLSDLPYLTLHDLSVAHAEALSWANELGS